MESVYLLIPVSVILVFLIAGVFWWSVRSGQFDDLDTPALDILDEWRLDRHYASKARLFDVSMQMAVLGRPKAEADQPAGSDKNGKQDKEKDKDKSKGHKDK